MLYQTFMKTSPVTNKDNSFPNDNKEIIKGET